MMSKRNKEGKKRELTVNKNILASVLVIVQPAVEASVSQRELEPVVQVQLQFVLGLVLEVTKLAVDSAWEGTVERETFFRETFV